MKELLADTAAIYVPLLALLGKAVVWPVVILLVCISFAAEWAGEQLTEVLAWLDQQMSR